MKTRVFLLFAVLALLAFSLPIGAQDSDVVFPVELPEQVECQQIGRAHV